MKIPSEVKEILEALSKEGFPSYVVGGAVRDSLLGRPCKDYDIATPAGSEDIQRIFVGNVYRKNGKHGTLVVHHAGQDYEVTTFRGEDQTSLEEDLALRDFTIDSLAADEDGKIVDPLGGMEDLKNKVIRANPVAKDRLEEDPLRILRAIRFEGEFGFEIEGKTKSAMRKAAPLLSRVSPERIGQEFLKIIVLKTADTCIRNHKEIFFEIFPELKPCDGFQQHSSFHRFDVFEHSLQVLKAVRPRDEVLCFAALFHDVAKPQTFFLKDGEGHFYGHAEAGAKIVESIGKRLKFPNAFVEEASTLVAIHMVQIEEMKTVKHYLNKYGKETFLHFIDLREADILGCSGAPRQKIPYVESLRKAVKTIETEKQPFSLKDLQVGGRDLLEIGIPAGPEIGKILNTLLDEVMSGVLPNQKASLLARAKELDSPKNKINQA